MVFLARLLCQRPKGADFGLYAGVNIMSGVKVTFSNKKLETNYQCCVLIEKNNKMEYPEVYSGCTGFPEAHGYCQLECSQCLCIV